MERSYVILRYHYHLDIPCVLKIFCFFLIPLDLCVLYAWLGAGIRMRHQLSSNSVGDNRYNAELQRKPDLEQRQIPFSFVFFSLRYICIHDMCAHARITHTQTYTDTDTKNRRTILCFILIRMQERHACR